MRTRKLFLGLWTLLAVLFWSAAASAQRPTGTITGRVVDADSRRPVVGASVSLVGTTRMAVTNEEGGFVFTGVPAGTHQVRVEVIGYTLSDLRVTVTSGLATNVSFDMRPQAVALRELVVVGYGTQRRRDLTGSVASIQSQDLSRNIITSLQQGLQGQVAGVQVTQGDAAPGGGIRVQVRGTNSMNAGSAKPLYVIDGVPIGDDGLSKRSLGARSEENLTSLTDTNPLSTLSPGDIEAVEILKDASATAIYGSRGANGVVLITTKKGARTRGGEFSLNYAQGYTSVVDKVPVLNAYDFTSYVNQAYINAFGPNSEYPYGGRLGSKTPEQIRDEVGAGTNWQDLIFRTARVNDAQLGFSGGDQFGSYAIIGSLLRQDGVVLGSAFDRGSLRINLERALSPWIRVSTNMAVTRSVNDMVRTSTINGYRSIGVIRQAITYAPLQLVDSTRLTSDPRAEDSYSWQQWGANPLRYTDEVSERDQQTRGIGGVKALIDLAKGLALDVSLGANYERRTYGVYFPRTVEEGRGAQGDAVQSGSEFGNILNENLLRFNRQIGSDHRVDAIGGFTYETDRATWSGTEVTAFPNDILRGNVLQNGTGKPAVYSGVSEWNIASWLGRVNYAFKDRYLFTATVRSDGSSKFAENNKWATFPSLAGAWRISEEPFARGRTPLNDIKLRVSWGKSGNQAVDAYQSLPAIGGISDVTLGEQVVPAYVVTQLGNPDLRWETTSQYNYGLDVGAWNNRLSASFDLYRKRTENLLQQITLAGNTGFSNAWLNSGEVTNRGFEVQASFNVLQPGSTNGLGWTISANASTNKNKIENLGPLPQQFATRLGAGGGLEVTPFIQKPGQPIGAMWGFKTGGLVKSAADSVAYAALSPPSFKVGDYQLVDVNGDGAITDSDQSIIGDANPDWTFGFNNRFVFGKFDLSALLTAVRGNSIINTERIRYLQLNGSINVPERYVKGAWDPQTNPNGTYPRIRQDRQSSNRFLDVYIEDGSYVRLKNVQLGYKVNLPRARNARIYVNAVNLFTWTDYTGFDPEVSAFGGVDRPGVDQGSYPQSRFISFGVTTSF